MAKPAFATRPSGGSIFSDLANAGAGFAMGLQKEKEKQEQARIAQAMRDFDQTMKVESLGLQKKQAGLQDAMFNQQIDEDAKAEADRIVGRTLQKQGLEQQAERDAAEKEDKRLRREFEDRQLKQNAQLERERIAANLQAKKWDLANDGNSRYTSWLNTRADNLRGQENDMKNDPDIRISGWNMPKAIADLQARKANLEKSTSPGAKTELATVQAKLDKISQYQAIKAERIQVNNDLRDAANTANELSRKMGGSGNVAQVEPGYKNYSAEERQAAIVQLANAMKNKAALGEKVDYDKYLDFGMPEADIEQAEILAGLAPAPVAAPPVVLPPVTVTPNVPSAGGIPSQPVAPTPPPVQNQGPFQPAPFFTPPPALPQRPAITPKGGGLADPANPAPFGLPRKQPFFVDRDSTKYRVKPPQF